MKPRSGDMTWSAGEIDHSFCNSLDAGEYLSTALYNGGYYGRRAR